MVPWFAFSTFCAITIGQEILVLVLTPALVAGVIADEKQRKTLHYLMASQLSSAEIVLGKLLVRMLYVAVLLGVSLPILSLLVLLGGVDPRLGAAFCVERPSVQAGSWHHFRSGFRPSPGEFARHFSLPSDWNASGYSRRSS